DGQLRGSEERSAQGRHQDASLQLRRRCRGRSAGEHRRRHDHAQLRRSEEEPDRDRRRRVHRLRHLASRARHGRRRRDHRCRSRGDQGRAGGHGRGGNAGARDQEGRSAPEEGDLVDATLAELLLLELVLVAILGVLSASEAALHTIRRPQLIEELASRGRRGRRAGTMGRKAVEYLASIQVAEFLIVFAFSGISAAYIAPRLSDLLRFIFGRDAPVVRDVAAVAVTVTALCLIAVLFGIFVPRTIGARHAQTVLLILVWPLELITWLMRPLVAILFTLTRLFTSPFGGNPLSSALVTED